ncbi:hypothetical protein IGI37_001488 [Enterococcus sp. AZ194]|uniref:YdcF family protein n=1 Tax=Enterococcus sp. AZ194 TaxID=2774629 RepID=UPI003F1FDFF6
MNEKEKWNYLLRYLAEKQEPSSEAEILILAGNCLPYLTQEAGRLLTLGKVQTILLSGGVGHATEKLRNNYRHLGYQFSKRLSEAEMNAVYLQDNFAISDAQLLLETTSTNCGENARFTFQMLQETQPTRVFLMNDPILQRRTRATFEKEWQETATEFENYVPLVPIVTQVSPLLFEQKELRHSWSVHYFKALVLGELSRMQDTTEGYGSKGKNFMNDIRMPKAVQSIFKDLINNENPDVFFRKK